MSVANDFALLKKIKRIEGDQLRIGALRKFMRKRKDRGNHCRLSPEKINKIKSPAEQLKAIYGNPSRGAWEITGAVLIALFFLWLMYSTYAEYLS